MDITHSDGRFVYIQGWSRDNAPQERVKVFNGQDTVLVLARLVYKDDIGIQPPKDECYFLTPLNVAAHFGMQGGENWQECKFSSPKQQ